MSQTGKASVEDRLHAYGDVLEQAIQRDPPVRIPSGRPSLGRRVAVAAAVVVVLAVVGGALTRVLDGTGVVDTDSSSNDESPVQEPAPPDDVRPAPDADTFAGFEACAIGYDALDERALAGAVEDSFDPRAGTVERVVLALPDSPAAVRVLLIGAEILVSCRVSRDSLTIADVGVGGRDRSQLPDDDEILLIDQHWSSTESGRTGPGDLEAVGRVGSGVAAVWVGLPDGTALPALIDDNGWFAVDGDVPRNVPLFEERYFWRLSDGSVRSAPAEDLDGETPEEQCAVTPGCVEQRVSELQATAATEGADRQADALADGVVELAELQAAVRETVDCLAMSGLDAESLDDGTGIFLNHGDDDPRTSQDTLESCSRSHSDLVSELYRLREAEAQLTDD